MSEERPIVAVLQMPRSEAHTAFVEAVGALALAGGAPPGEWFLVSCRVRLNDDGAVSVRRLTMLGPEEEEPN